MSADPQTFLTKKYPHPRDDHISFDEGPHIYTIDGDSDYTSVTTWVHKHFPAFDSNKIIDGMMRSPKWPQNKYYGKTKEEILVDVRTTLSVPLPPERSIPLVISDAAAI